MTLAIILISRVTHLVVETSLLVEEIEIFAVAFIPPEVKIANLKIAPDCQRLSTWPGDHVSLTYSDTCCKSLRRRLTGSPSRCLD
jgi:hypothetical protein